MDKLTTTVADTQLFKPKNIDGLPIGRLVLTVADLQQALGISKNTAYELVNRAGFPVLRVGRRLLIPRDSFMKWIEDQTNRAAG